MTEQQHSDMPEQDDLLGLEPDTAEVIRLSDALACQESGAALDLDPQEDPALTSLVQTSVAITAAFERSTETEAFERFHHRTRANIVTAIARARQPAETDANTPRPSLLQRWNGLFTATAAAAAASVATFVVTIAALGNSTPVAPLVADVQPADETPAAAVAVVAPDQSAESAVNLTSLSLDGQLDLWRETLLTVATLTNDGQPLDEALLRQLTDATASVARQIERQPEAMNGASVFVTYQAAFASQQALGVATAAETDQPALDAAHVAADQAFVVAARYFEQNPERMPSSDEVALRLGTAVAGADAVDDGSTATDSADEPAP